jgi:hypothetical protein
VQTLVSPVTPAESSASYDFRHPTAAGARQPTEDDHHHGLLGFPIIVKDLQDNWVELKCPDCGANSSDGRFLSGKRGLAAHSRTAHKTARPYQQIWQQCIHKTLSEKDIGDLLSGKSTIEKVEYKPSTRQSSVSIGSSHIITPQYRANNTAYLRNFGCVVRNAQGQWLELACCICNANYYETRQKQSFFSGFSGILAHLTQRHPTAKHDLKAKRLGDVVWDKCVVRSLDETDIQSLMAGLATIEKKLAEAARHPSTGLGELEPPQKVDDERQESEDGDRDYDYLVNFPTIVLRADRVWVELRCIICGGNSLPSSNRYLKGALGFTHHTNNAHGKTNTQETNSQGWSKTVALAVETCTYREISQEEIDLITDDKTRPKDYAIPRIPVGNNKDMARDKSTKNITSPQKSTTTSSQPGPKKVPAPPNNLPEPVKPLTKKGAIPRSTKKNLKDRRSTLPKAASPPRFKSKVARKSAVHNPPTASGHGEDDKGGSWSTSEDSVIRPSKTKKKRVITISSDGPGVTYGSHRATKRRRRVVADEEEGSDNDLSPSVAYGSHQNGVTTSTQPSSPPPVGFVPTKKAKASATTNHLTSIKPDRISSSSARPTPRKSATPAATRSSSGKDLVPPKFSMSTPKPSPLKQSSTPASPLKQEPGKVDLSLYCPCTLQGHECRSANCTLKELCTNSPHDQRCMVSKPSYAHNTQPSCLDLLLNELCTDKDCKFGHDQTEHRQQILEDHSDACLQH